MDAPNTATVRRLQKQREAAAAAAEAVKAQFRDEAGVSADFATRFAARASTAEDRISAATVGLQSQSDWARKRDELVLKDKEREEEEKARVLAEKQRQAARKNARKLKLSFNGDSDDDDDDDDGECNNDNDNNVATATSTAVTSAAAAASGGSGGGDGGDHGKRAGTGDVAQPVLKKPRLGKDPTVRTDFLPDRERDEMERKRVEMLKQQYLEEQERVKALPLTVTYSYWDGSGHRSQVTLKQGDSVEYFLEQVKKQFPDQLRGVSSDMLMFVKEDIILPAHITFYQLIRDKVRGKSGPLYSFEITEDVRLVNDGGESVESHPGKVCEKAWYQRNKHLFPATRWEPLDLSKTFDRYSIKS